tara:strand:+ start:45345 stop:46847 length:1503 start_codon:yes stop_codon:yes gene_type:complete
VRIKITKKLISEALLNEITYASAVNNLGSKKMRKAVTRWVEKNLEIVMDEPKKANPEYVTDKMVQLKTWLLDLIPDDLEDNQKGLLVTWLARLARDLDTGYMATIINRGDPAPGPASPRDALDSGTWRLAEMFFHYQQFMSEKDLNRIRDLEHLRDVVDEARPKIKDYQDKRTYLDAEKGTEVFRDDDEWLIAALHNKGAACSLGKGTDWCTAAPGLNYFAEYYEPNDPLFYFQSKRTKERWQFHYGSEQFMDEDDIPISEDETMLLHDLLMKTEASSKYKVLKQYTIHQQVLNNETPAEVLKKIVDNEISGPGDPDSAHWSVLNQILLHPNMEDSEEYVSKVLNVVEEQEDPWALHAVLSTVANITNDPKRLRDVFSQATPVARAIAQKEMDRPGAIPGYVDHTTAAKRNKLIVNVMYNSSVPNDVLEKISKMRSDDTLHSDYSFYAETLLAFRAKGENPSSNEILAAMRDAETMPTPLALPKPAPVREEYQRWQKLIK